MSLLIKVEHLSEDAKTRELCRLFWELEGRKFTYTIEELGLRFGIHRTQVPKTVFANSRAFFAEYTCRDCGGPVGVFRRRMDPVEYYRDFRRERCDECERKERDRQIEEECRRGEALRQAEEKYRMQQLEALQLQREEDTRQMQLAWERDVYETLSLIEFNCLVQMAVTGHMKKAQLAMGLSKDDAVKIMQKLHDLFLIRVEDRDFRMLPELKRALISIGVKRRVGPVFGSPKARDAYRMLKQKYMFVFPEIPLCAFIGKGAMEHLFTEPWHERYFLTCRSDFVVCDFEGYPEFAVEYNGGYHEDGQQTGRDEFKRRILNEVGLPLRVINRQDFADTNAE
ncbi:MAG: DUF2726 domain-containing protein [Calditrichia bacterium]